MGCGRLLATYQSLLHRALDSMGGFGCSRGQYASPRDLQRKINGGMSTFTSNLVIYAGVLW